MEYQDQKIEVLLESLPYIKKFYGKIAVIKYGGHAIISPDLQSSFIKDITLLRFVGMRPVIVHGGGPDITDTMAIFGKEAEYVNGLRVTDEETMDIVQMVLTGKISPTISSLLNANDVPAVTISGKDGMTIRAEQRDPALGLVGSILDIDTTLIMDLIDRDYVPVISPIAIGPKGETFNINADEVAGRLAGALEAYKLIMVTDVDGLLRDESDPATFVHRADLAEIREMIDAKIIHGGMLPKVESCAIALNEGAERCHIINGKRPHSILLELFTNNGIGTMITA